MRRINSRQKPEIHIRAKKPLSIEKARQYFRKKDHSESAIVFWKHKKSGR